MKECYFMTGATGQIGQRLMIELLRRNIHLVILARGKGELTASQRIHQIVTKWEKRLGIFLPLPTTVEGDINEDNLGLNHQNLAVVGRYCKGVIHNAASLTFIGDDHTKDPWKTNFAGTARVSQACDRLGISEMHYVSTAFVCGKQAGPVFEEAMADTESIHAPRELFRNGYEASKHEAEKLVRRSRFDSLTVYRPGMVLGDSRTGHTTSYDGLYPYMQLAHLLTQNAGPDARDPEGRPVLRLRLDVTGNEHRNLVTVDWVAEVMAHIVADQAHHGKTYHLTPWEPVTAAELEAGMRAKMGFVGPTFVGPDGLKNTELSEVEKLFYRGVEQYQPYWRGEPLFDVTNVKAAVPHILCPKITPEVLGRLYRFAIEDRWGRGPKKSTGTAEYIQEVSVDFGPTVPFVRQESIFRQIFPPIPPPAISLPTSATPTSKFITSRPIVGPNANPASVTAQLLAKDDADRYHHAQGVQFVPAAVTGRTSIEVLSWLKGVPYTNLVLAYVQALRPSKVRVGGEYTTDSCPWRVSIDLDDRGHVRRITQEVEIGYGSGSDVGQVLRDVQENTKAA